MDSVEGDRFVELAIADPRLLSVRAGNRRMTEKHRLAYELGRTASGQAILLKLMQDARPPVRLEAATAALGFAQERAVATLEAPETDQEVGSNARGNLKGFRLGFLDSDTVPREKVRVPNNRVTDEDLDDALQVHGLVMNGGLVRAWEHDAIAFERAATTLETIDRTDASDLLRAVLRVAADRPFSQDAMAQADAASLDYHGLPDVQDSIEAVDLA